MDTNVETVNKPRSVKVAVVLLWTSILLSFIAMAIQYRTIQTLVPNSNAIILSFIITLFFSLLLIIKISAGRNWARVVYIILTAFSTTSFLYSYLILGGSEYTDIQIVLGFVNNSLDVFISFLLLGKSASPWFSRHNTNKFHDPVDANKDHNATDEESDSSPIDSDFVYKNFRG